ncbi:serine/threonine-protein phosphatase PP1 [Drosophila grimshawi]|uniref:Serine/threonine-protein phosphatase n=1 Tax=Drosophila grimshawi TaxID=7222 RepID=B4J6A4_DROGR|nr:serine/threonine-protein phosphatase PP1 [Drosophila grimshawi]EDW00877.1 GH21129 [Drosophila grimshawi]DAA06400.1 TPA_inf: protein phosphatase catalytic subunit 1 [Drosophila grimshawi]
MLEKHLDDMISALLAWKSDKRITVPEVDIFKLLYEARNILKDDPMLLEVDAPVNVVGDIHGQFGDMLRYFDSTGYPPKANYLFLGDYVDRGKYSVETLTLLLAYKVKFPECIYLLRGNHESANINQMYGFFDECKRRFTVRLWRCFVDTYSCMPVAAIIGGRIFCCHGGLSPLLHEMDEIRNLPRPCDIKSNGLLCDLLWSDPDPAVTRWAKNSRGVSFTFGTEIVQQFITRFKFDMICRAHQVVEDGYEFFAKRQLITIFSAVNYCGEYDNAGAMMCVDKLLTISLVIIKPTTREIDLNCNFKNPELANAK